MESKFINKNNLAQLNNLLNNQLNLQSKSKEEKKDILNSLLGNMRKVYNKLDKSKITEKNLNKVLNTFNKYAVENTIQEYNYNYQRKNINVAQEKINRDNELNNNKKVQFMDRPQFTSMPTEKNYDLTSRNIDFHNKPIFDNQFKQESSRYRGNKNNNSSRTMENLISERKNLVPEIQRPATPEFLKTTNISKNKEEKNEIVENFNNSYST